MLVAAGGANVAEAFGDAYPRVAIEWVVEQAPDVIIDMSPDAELPTEYWSRWQSLPAVQQQRVLRLDQSVTLPGPALDVSLESLAIALHGSEISAEIRDAREQGRAGAATPESAK
jgi:ABC-type Fe3+-hydroxamate transport system substrate-binding protein